MNKRLHTSNKHGELVVHIWISFATASLASQAAAAAAAASPLTSLGSCRALAVRTKCLPNSERPLQETIQTEVGRRERGSS